MVTFEQEEIYIAGPEIHSISLGTYPVQNGFLLTNRAKEYLQIIKPEIFIKKTGSNGWGIYWYDHRLNMETNRFEYEPSPSSRTDRFIEQTRFDSIDNAKDFWYNVHIKSILDDAKKQRRGILGLLDVRILDDGIVCPDYRKWDTNDSRY